MENEDDDFGDLYADVEAEATSAINTAPQSSNSQPVADEIDKQGEDEDDDGDDFDIVLNSDDDSNKRGNGFSIARSRDLEDEEDANLYKVFFQSQLAAYGSDFQGIGCMQAAYWQQLGLRSLGPQSAQSFSLPRARNILDVNIDVFEQKPWKHPGANITDYFNFGFDEDSWKLYCNKVDEYRHRGPVSSGTLLSEPVQSTEVDVFQGKGQAIEVEDSIFERQLSMDVKRQLDRDSDAIQITILDPEDPCVPDTSNHGDVSGDDDHLSFSSDATDETIRSLNDSKESSLVEEESVEEERSPENHSNSNKIDSYIDRRKACTHGRCVTELTQSDYHHSEDSNKSDDKRGRDEKRDHATRLGDNNNNGDRSIYHERSNNPVYKTRTHKEFNPKRVHENDYIISRRLDKRKYFDFYEENVLYSKLQLPSDYHGKRFCSYEDWDADRFGPDMDRPVFRNSEDDDKRRRYIEDNRMMEQDENGQKRNKGEIDEFYLDSGYYDDTQGKLFRSYTKNDKQKYDVEYIRWEFRGNKRTHCSFELDNSSLRRDDVEFLASRSSEESHFNNDRWHDKVMPKSSFYTRHGSYERRRFEPFDKEDYMIDIDDPYVVYSQLVNGSDFVKGLTSGQHAATEQRYYKQKNEVFTGNKCGNTYGKSRQRLLPPWSRNSHLVARAVKSFKKHKNNKVARAEETKAIDESLDNEEGQILTKEVKVGPVLGKTREHVNRPHNRIGNPGIDNARILEAMERMEKRRARFNEPNAAITRKDSDILIKVAVVGQVQETGSNKQQRPARKRRWGATAD